MVYANDSSVPKWALGVVTGPKHYITSGSGINRIVVSSYVIRGVIESCGGMRVDRVVPDVHARKFRGSILRFIADDDLAEVTGE